MRKKDVLAYAGRTTRSRKDTLIVDKVDIGGSEHLIIDLYIARELVLRVAVSDTDYASYDYSNNKWEQVRSSYKFPYKDNIDHANISSDDSRKLEEYYGGKKEYYRTRTQVICNIEDKVQALKDEIAKEKERKERDHLMKLVPKESKMLKTDIDIYANQGNIIYYKRKGNIAEYHCCQCDSDYTRRIKSSDSYEDAMVTPIAKVPRLNETEECPYCKKTGVLKQAGHAKTTRQRFEILTYNLAKDDTTLVVREYYICVSRSMYGRYNIYNKLCGISFLRAGYERTYQMWGNSMFRRKKLDIDRKIDVHELREEDVISKSDLKYYPENMYKLISETRWKETLRVIARFETLSAYANCTALETLYKIGLNTICRRIIYAGGHTSDIKKNAKTAADILKVSKEGFRYIRSVIGKQDSDRIINTIRYMESRKIPLSENNIKILSEFESYYYPGNAMKLEHIMKYQSLQKLYNYLNKAKEHYSSLPDALDEYYDYIKQRETRGDDLTNTVYLRPKALHATYMNLLEDIEHEKNEKYISEMSKKYENIRKRSKNIPKKYTWQQSDMLIRPARSAEEIVMEGRLLHHCVGNDAQGYMERFNEGKGWILVVRHISEPDIPFVTVELVNNSIKQWYGIRDTKPDRDNVEAFLNAYIEHITNKGVERTA